MVTYKQEYHIWLFTSNQKWHIWSFKTRNDISSHLQTEITYLVIHLQPEMTYLVIYNQKWHIWWFTYGQKCHIWSFTNRNDSLKTRNDILLFTCNQKWIIWPMTFCNLWREGGSTPKFNTNNAKNECQFGIGLVNYNVFYLWFCPNAMAPKNGLVVFFPKLAN